MSGLRVRRALPEHAEALARLSRRPFAAAWSQDAYAAEAEREDAVALVAEEDDVVRGYAVARVAAGELRLLDLAVETDGRGIGRALWAGLLTAARARGAATLTLEVSAANARALEFYERQGARIVGRRPKFYNDGSDAVLMDVPLA